jgi:putative aldouronate transport system permease protein
MKEQTKRKINDEAWFDTLVILIGSIIFVAVLYPLIFVISASFSSPVKVMNGDMWLWPVDFTLNAYKEVFKNPDIWIGYRNSLFYTGVGTVINLVLTILAAYPLSRRDLPGRNIFMFAITFTMFFHGGLIPMYLIVKDLNMVNTVWALMIPNAIATYNLIVMRSYFQSSIPWEIQEAAFLDGCSNTKLLTSIILPLAKPIMAVIVLFYAVQHWNAFFNALIYLRNEELYPLQLILRRILIVNQAADDGGTDMNERLMLAESIKYALIIVASIPVLLIYPLVARHFVKGVMIGSIKG